MQRWKKMAAPNVLIFHSCGICLLFHTIFVFFCVQFWAFLLSFAWFWAFFGHILCANFSDSKFCGCYFVSVFHLWAEGIEKGLARTLIRIAMEMILTEIVTCLLWCVARPLNYLHTFKYRFLRSLRLQFLSSNSSF